MICGVALSGTFLKTVVQFMTRINPLVCSMPPTIINCISIMFSVLSIPPTPKHRIVICISTFVHISSLTNVFYFHFSTGKSARSTISHLDAIDIPVTPPDARLFGAETRWQSAVRCDTRAKHVLRWPEERHDTLEGASTLDTR